MWQRFLGAVLALGAPLGMLVGFIFAVPDFIRYRKMRLM
jgi:hypothetical protein